MKARTRFSNVRCTPIDRIAPQEPVVTVLHSGATSAALAERARSLIVERPLQHAPERSVIEIVRDELKVHHLAHQTFTHPGVLDQATTMPSLR